jgi:pyruvate/2-oxoglutarate dehydrogenase complex dihydrolipoamide dehydrogenase (E3) component
VAVFSGPSSLVVQDGDGAQMAVFEDMPVIAAPGSVPVFPGPLKPDGKRVLAPRFLSKLDKLPQSMIVVGAGATGCESAYLFNALGLNVTWIVDQYGILPQFYQPAGIALGEALSDQGVTIRAGHMVAELQREEDRVTAVLVDGATYAAEMAFVAVGRRPDWDRLNLAAAGVAPADDQPLALSAFGQTANPLVYVVGDADGRAMTANKAAAQARIAARHACGAETAAFSLDFVPQPVFSEPQVAQVGQMDGEGITVVRVPFTESLKGHILNDQGFVALAYEEESGRVRGATAIGPHAADVVAPVMTALSMQATVSALAGLYGAYPTVSELPFIAAREAMGP